MTQIDEIIKAAKAEVGYLEKSRDAYVHNPQCIWYKLDGAGYDNYTKYAYVLDREDWYGGMPKQGFPWCCVFVDYLFFKCFGIDEAKRLKNHGIYDAVVDYAIDQYKAIGRWSHTPHKGDQIFFCDSDGDPCHTGIVVDVDDTYVHTIEGNTNSQDGYVESNGGGVFLKKYRKDYWRLYGYGSPLYEEDDDYMTDKEIFEAYNRYANARKVPESMQAEYEEAIDMGITDGSRPMATCTRLEATLLTKRAVEKIK